MRLKAGIVPRHSISLRDSFVYLHQHASAAEADGLEVWVRGCLLDGVNHFGRSFIRSFVMSNINNTIAKRKKGYECIPCTRIMKMHLSVC
jgi:hypothetical protein